MTLQQLHYILALDEYRHFVRAAESCRVAQPTLTLQVKKLETEVGFNIFDRSSKPLKPTATGERFLARSRQIIREVDALKNFVNEEKHQLSGTFKIGIIPTLAPYLLPLFLKNFIDEHPMVNLEIKEMQSNLVMEKLRNATIDIGLMATPTEDRKLREVPLFNEPFHVYAHPNHRLLRNEYLVADNLREEGLWILDQGHCFRNQVLNICQNESEHALERTSFDSGSIETLKNMIKSYNGYTLVPELAIDEMDIDYIKSFAQPQPSREISLVVNKGFSKELLLQELKKAILKTIPGHFSRNNKMVTIKWR